MSLNTLINQAIRRVINTLVRRGVNKGIEAASRKAGAKPATPAQQKAVNDHRAAVKRARAAARLNRR